MGLSDRCNIVPENLELFSHNTPICLEILIIDSLSIIGIPVRLQRDVRWLLSYELNIELIDGLVQDCRT